MPIKGFDQVQRIPRLGKVRLGFKKQNANGVEYPVKTDYFVCKDAPRIEALYGATPRSLPIEFYSNDVEEVFPCWMKLYGRGGALRCKGDGERALFRYTRPSQTNGAAPEPLVEDGIICNEEFRRKYGADVYRCPCQDGDEAWHQSQEKPKRAPCQPTGRLLFGLRAEPQLGYYELVCHQRAIKGILSVFKLAFGSFGRISFVPFALELLTEQLTVGGSAQTVYTPILRVEPDYAIAALTERRREALPGYKAEGELPEPPKRLALPAVTMIDAEQEPDGDDIAVDENTGEVLEPAPQNEMRDAPPVAKGRRNGHLMPEHEAIGRAMRDDATMNPDAQAPYNPDLWGELPEYPRFWQELAKAKGLERPALEAIVKTLYARPGSFPAWTKRGQVWADVCAAVDRTEAQQ